MPSARWPLLAIIMLQSQSVAYAEGPGVFIDKLIKQTIYGDVLPIEREYLEPKLYGYFAKLEKNKKCLKVPTLSTEVTTTKVINLKNYLISVPSDDATRAIVSVQITDLNNFSIVTNYELVNVSGSWKIHDICPSEEKDKHQCYRATLLAYKCN